LKAERERERERERESSENGDIARGCCCDKSSGEAWRAGCDYCELS